MRLSDVLSKPPKQDYLQVDGFLLNKRGNIGQQIPLSVGDVMLNYYCTRCEDVRTFISKGKLCCVFVNKHIVSIDCVMRCGCDTDVQAWFLIECEDDIRGQEPKIRILKRSENLSDLVKINDERYGEFSSLLDMAERAYRDKLGAGSIVYLRKIFERITVQAADAANISKKKRNGHRKPFHNLLEEVDKQCSIIPKEFSANGYKLFGEMSDIVHGEFDEQEGLKKYEPFRRLVVGIIDNIRNNSEMMAAIGSLGWNEEGGKPDVKA